MGSKLRGDGVEFPDQSVQTTAAASSISTMETFYASGDFIKPVGVTRLEITLVGGGAGAGLLLWQPDFYGGTNYDSDGDFTYDLQTGFADWYGTQTTITIDNQIYKARGGWIRNETNHAYMSNLSLHKQYGGQAGYLGENGFVGPTYWAETSGYSSAYKGNFSSIPDYPNHPLAFGGSGYGFEGGSLKDYADNWTVATDRQGTDYQKRHADPSGWAGGAGGYSRNHGHTGAQYASNGGNGGGSDFGSLGGDPAGTQPPNVYSTESGRGYVGGGGAAVDISSNYIIYIGGGGGGAGAGGGGCYVTYPPAGSTGEQKIYGGDAGQVVTFQIDVPSGGTIAQRTYPIVIGTGGNGLFKGNIRGGAGGQGVAIIKY